MISSALNGSGFHAAIVVGDSSPYYTVSLDPAFWATRMLDSLKPIPPDAILGIMALYRTDQDPNKVDLSVGVYQDESGLTPVLECVKRAERDVYSAEDSKTYVAIAGNAGFNRGVEELLFGADHPALTDGRVATVQSPGGSGAISVVGHLVQRARPDTRV